MNNRKATAWLACLLAVAMMVACAAPAAVSPAGGQAQSSAGTEDTGASTAATAVAVTVAQTVAAQAGATSAAAASANEQNAAAEQTWDEAQAVAITLNGTSIAVQGQGVTVSGSTATITSVGTYVLSGSLADGQVIVNVPGKQTVTLVLNGVNMHSATGSPIWVMDADQVVLVLADGTENFVSDAQSYLLPSPDDDEPNAAVFSKADLTITGYGSLTVEGNYNDGITSKDGLVIRSGTIAVNAVDDGIRGKDYIIIEDGNIT
ncbi:MAG: carbohydrate-binding domain-containing protein, partial [Chloroflexi bacterium]|nr:carbohydrate-binding domain-containing protein [Chloroflexota bacterium]